MTNFRQKFASLIRKAITVLLLVPSSLLTQSGRAAWKHFLLRLLNQSEQMSQEISKKGRLQGALIGLPLLLSGLIHNYGSLWGGLAALRNRKYSVQAAQRLELSSLSPEKINTWLAPVYEISDVSIADQAHCLSGEDNFSGQTVVVMAHWDKERLIDPYVRHMLAHFRSLNWKVILTSADNLADDDLPPLDGLVYRTCKGYDFTSWKAALHVFPSLLQAKELILCNDSVFGPVGSYLPMHKSMSAVECDFWGAAYSREQIPHLQSFYLVLRAPALRNPAFASLFRKIPLSDDRSLAVQLELRFTLWLAHHGLQAATFAALTPNAPEALNPMHSAWKLLLDAGVPMIKRDLLFKNPLHLDLTGWADIISKKGYPLPILRAYADRVEQNLPPNRRPKPETDN